MEYLINESIDLSGNEQCIKITVKQGDMNSRLCVFTLTKDGAEFTPPDGTTARVSWKKPDGTQVLRDVELEQNRVSFELTQQMLSAAGEAKCEILLFSGDELLSSGLLKVLIMPVSYDYDEMESSDEYQTFINALQAVAPLIESCNNAAEAATAAAKAADENAQKAASSAEAATTAANDATAAANDATAAAENANSVSQTIEEAADRATEAAELVENSNLEDIARRMGSRCTEVTGSLNNVKTSGWYSGNLNKTSDTPPNGGTVFFILLVYKMSLAFVIQDLYFIGFNPVRYTRTYRLQSDNTTAWGSWNLLSGQTEESET